MDTNEITARLAEVQEELTAISNQRRESALALANSLGTETAQGVNLDELSKWARDTIKLNVALKELAEERRALRAARRELSPCTCNCH